MPILLPINANSHTCGFDAITFVGFMDSLEVTITVCYNIVFLGFSLPEIGSCTNFRSQLFWFDHFWVFSVSKVISCCLMAFVADLKWRQQLDAVSAFQVNSVLKLPEKPKIKEVYSYVRNIFHVFRVVSKTSSCLSIAHFFECSIYRGPLELFRAWIGLLDRLMTSKWFWNCSITSFYRFFMKICIYFRFLIGFRTKESN